MYFCHKNNSWSAQNLSGLFLNVLALFIALIADAGYSIVIRRKVFYWSKYT